MHLTIEYCGVAPVPNAGCSVTVDDYIPLRWRSYEGTLGGRLVRLGNFKTSLLEIIVEADSMTIRGCTLTLADRQHRPLPRVGQRVVEGLPIIAVAGDFVGQAGLERMDLHREFSVGWGEDFVELDFGELAKANQRVTCGAVEFLVAEGWLQGMRIAGLSRAQVAQGVAACGTLPQVTLNSTDI